jgi:hypothetical protein
VGYAGPVLRSQGSFGEDRLSRGARGEGLIASNARSGPIPLRCGFMGLRETGPALAGKLWRGSAFARCARGGFDRFQCLLRTDPAPLRFYGATRDQSCARREALERIGFRAVR